MEFIGIGKALLAQRRALLKPASDCKEDNQLKNFGGGFLFVLKKFILKSFGPLSPLFCRLEKL